jgi:3-oxoadipate enol-lactonase
MTPDPFVDNLGARISYSVDGPPGAPVILFINSIGTTRELWSRQVRTLSNAYRVITYDARGHGRSSVPPGEYTIEQLGRDALAILDTERAATAHLCGISLGGITALWLGVHAPGRLRTLTAANTAARIATPQFWKERIEFVQTQGMTALAEPTMTRWFTEAFRTREPETVQRFKSMVERISPIGYAGCSAAMRDEDLREAIAAIRCPVLAIAGRTDPATPPEGLQFIHEKIAGSKLLTLECAHLSNVECAGQFNEGLRDFIGAS